MDELQARTIIETICKGIDPLTGYELRQSDVCSSKTVQEALRLLLENCTIPTTDEYYKLLYKENKKKSKVKQNNSGKPWTKSADASLLHLSKTQSIAQLASTFERSEYAIESRLDYLRSGRNRSVTAKADKLRKASKRNLQMYPHYDSRPWSEEDDADLLFMAKTYTTTQLASILGRSINAVESRLRHLGYRESYAPKVGQKTYRKASENSGKPWSQADEKILVEMFRSGKSNEEICGYFRRSETAIAARLVKLGIIRNRDEFRDR